ncbi:MAG: hypothetical protein AB1921_13130 [Thermodesulfobacteriota bacterium]
MDMNVKPRGQGGKVFLARRRFCAAENNGKIPPLPCGFPEGVTPIAAISVLFNKKMNEKRLGDQEFILDGLSFFL